MPRSKAFDEERALDAAVERFWMHGYETTSVRDLADCMGIGGASLYNAYGGKRALFEKALERYASRSMRERIERLQAHHRPIVAIEAFFSEIIDRSVEDRDRKGCLLVNSAIDVAPQDAHIARAVGGYLDELRGFFRRNLEAARQAGRLPRTIDPEQFSNHLLGVLLGVRVLARTGARRAVLEAAVAPSLSALRAMSRRLH